MASSSTRSRSNAVRLRGVRRHATGFAFVAPALAVFGLFIAYPLYETVRLSFFDWDGLNAKLWVGLGNYHELLHQDPAFWHAARNTAIWALVTVPTQMVVGFLLAVLLDQKLRFRAVYRSVFFLPAVMSSVVIVFAWSWIYDPEVGVASRVLEAFGGHSQGWLANPRDALWCAMALSVWRYAGFSMLFYLAALQLIPPSLYEAARVDGAGTWEQVRRITIPMLKPTTALLVMLGIIGALREFDVIWILTRGGPAHATDILSTTIFNDAFNLSRPGYAAAIAVVLLGVSIAATAVALAAISRSNKAVNG
jgi:raffinose/stachyose/melibiose transport system permease protein